VVTSAGAGRAKPHAGIFARALDAMATAPGDALHCGDDPFADAEGARRAGMRPVLLDRAGRHAEASGQDRIRSLAELAHRL
jgi:putative hydrolase of the HAD superfamily